MILLTPFSQGRVQSAGKLGSLAASSLLGLGFLPKRAVAACAEDVIAYRRSSLAGGSHSSWRGFDVHGESMLSGLGRVAYLKSGWGSGLRESCS